ncbi:MAG TPA: transglycosylase domain-containing protein [Candidatus Limnocylindrales bacterium]|nr:transglycosylase domain-containing protein [Candidatus Limnocylindrales bacterium]
MQTSLARRQARRLSGGRRRGVGAAGKTAIAFPLFLFGALTFVALMGFVGTVGAYAYFARGLDDPRKLERIEFNEESIIYDRSGRYELASFGTERRQVVTFEEVPDVVLDATTAVEDKTFWSNTGFDPLGIGSAALDTIAGSSRGASTITQQLVRQRLLDEDLVKDPERRVERKVKEIIQSIRLTQAFPGREGKERIITAYLNQNFYGNNLYGVKAAARGYFDKDLDELTLAEAAILAGIVQSPTTYDLVRNGEEREVAVKGKLATRLVVPRDAEIVQRRNYILDLMADGRTPLSGDRYTREDFERAKRERVILAPQREPRWRAPHFVWAVRRQLAQEICGDGVETCPELERGGLRIITTLDWRLQRIAEKWVEAATLLPHSEDPEAYAQRLGLEYESWMGNLRDKDLYNGTLAALDWRRGEIVAYVGSADYYAKNLASPQFQPQFDVLSDGWRQPGSAFKPFNYVTGLNDGTMTASTMFMDVVTEFQRGWTPTDADPLERGPVRLRPALQFSLNIPAVKALAYNGVDHVFEMAKKFGMRFQTPQATAALSLTLGTQEVRPIDLLTAYGTLANGGRYVGHTTILRVFNTRNEDVIPRYDPPNPGKVVSPQAAYIITDILSGNTNPSINPYWGRFQILDSEGRHRPATLKTGTNNDAKDLNAYGYIGAPSGEGRQRGEYALTVGVWNGNSDNSLVSSPRNPLFSIDVSTYVWQGFMREATADWEIREFEQPDKLYATAVDAYMGYRPGSYSSRTVNELFIEGTGPANPEGSLRVAMEVDSSTGDLWREGCEGPKEKKAFLNLDTVESAFPVWQKANKEWAKRARKGPGVSGGPKGTKTSYFFNGAFHPFGATWGAPFPPSEKCEPMPSPTPTPTPTPTATPTPTEEPTPSPTPKPTKTPRPTKSPKPPPPTPTPTPTPSPTPSPMPVPSGSGG